MSILHLAIFIRCIRSFSVGLCCPISDSILRRSSRGIVLVIVHVNHARVKALLAASPIFDHSSKIFETEAETVPNPLRNQRSRLTSFDTVPLVCLCVCVGGGPNPRRRTEYASGYGPPGTISASVFGPAGPYPLADLVRPDHIWGGPNPLWHRPANSQRRPKFVHTQTQGSWMRKHVDLHGTSSLLEDLERAASKMPRETH